MWRSARRAAQGCPVVKFGSGGAARVAGDTPAAWTFQLARCAIDSTRPGHLVLPKPAQPARHVVFLHLAGALDRHIDHPALTRYHISWEDPSKRCVL